MIDSQIPTIDRVIAKDHSPPIEDSSCLHSENLIWLIMNA